jgi:hypothetical protein
VGDKDRPPEIWLYYMMVEMVKGDKGLRKLISASSGVHRITILIALSFTLQVSQNNNVRFSYW